MTSARLTVLATGGTIAGIAGSAIAHDYRAGEIGIDEYLEQVGGLGLGAELVGRQIANIDSADIGPAVWNPLHLAITEALADDECHGIIVTHGTDTLEETAFLLDLTLPADKPVVVVGAMRPADAVGYDGLRNFANAVRVAGDANAAGRGVLVVMGDRVFAARDVRKVRTRGTEAFRGFPRESVGLVTPSSLEWFGAPWRSGGRADFEWRDTLPEVAIIYAFAGLDAASVERQVGDTARGIVMAGVGEGNFSHGARQALVALARRGLPVVRASRTDEGLVDREPDDGENGFVAARALNPQKARILLQLLLAAGIVDPAAIQHCFDGRRPFNPMG
ncbi:asparaginase [Tsuneonella sp. SYSU-LHT278]|uniref:asparaginase n=1 Tax=Tsuneonella sediminis TaxID=3416089 RepID=UPI003F7A6BB8